MSHLSDAPLLKTRHQPRHDPRRHARALDLASFPLLDVDDHDDDSLASTAGRHAFASPSRRYKPYEPRPVALRTLRLPQIARRHAQAHADGRGPKFYHLEAKRAPVDLGRGDVFDIDQATDCRDLVENYQGEQAPGIVRRRCGVAVLEARKAAAATATATESSTASTLPRSTRDSTTTTTTRARRIAAQSVPARIAAVSLTANPTNSAALESNVNQIFSEAASIISSRSSSRAALATRVDSIFSQAASAISSRRVAATAATTTTASSSASSSSSPSPSASTSTLASTTSAQSSASNTSSRPSSTTAGPSSSSNPSSTSNSSGDSHRIRNIVVPSVVVPIGLLLLFLLGFFLWKKRKRRNEARAGRGGIGPISGPRPLRLAAGGNYGTTGAGAEMAGVGAGAMATAAARGGGRNGSNETLGTTPSAIGVAVSEPRSRWGRRSLVEALAGGVMGSGSASRSGGSASSPSPAASRAGGALHSRQESVTSSLDRGTGGYNSKGGYRPGMPRPFSPVQAQDAASFHDTMPTIVPVPPASQRPSSLSSNSDESLYNRSHADSHESATARFARPITAGYPLYETATTPGVESRTSTEGEQGYWTADAGINSSREAGVGDSDAQYRFASGGEDDEEELSPGELGVAEAPVNFGSSSSNSSGGSTPVVGGRSGSGTPRLGSGHGSRGYRRGDSSWWG